MSEASAELATPSAITTSRSQRLVYWLSRHWFSVFIVLYGLFVFLPWLAPLFMWLGWTGAGKTLYLAYAPLCHQLPQRSFFLFGFERMYSLELIQSVWKDTVNPLVLRGFIGTLDMGWKVAWSDRMVSMYTGIFFWALLYWPLRRRIKPLSFWGFVLLAVPMALDGITHTISDFYGIGVGFRDHNNWLALLTNNAFAPAFYAGDALGSFNSWMRLITGLLFSLGAVWLLLPHMAFGFADTEQRLARLFARQAE